MKYFILFAVVICFNANATYCPANSLYPGTLIASHPNGDCNYKPPTSTNPQNQTQQQNQSTQSNAKADSKSNSSAMQSLDSKNANNNKNDNSATNNLGPMGNDSSSFKAFAISLPTPVFTSPLPTIADCPGANVEQHAVAVGWNFFSKADAYINTDNCTAIRLYNMMVDTCQYESARKFLNLFSAKIMPGFQMETSQVMIDLTSKQCDGLKQPIINNNYTTVQTVVKSCEVTKKRPIIGKHKPIHRCPL